MATSSYQYLDPQASTDKVQPPGTYRDPESLEDVPLMPGISRTENALRWGFIKKVYGIVSFQLLLTAVLSAIIYTYEPVRNFVVTNAPFQITFAIVPFILLIPLYAYQNSHPWNLVLLTVWTFSLSIGVGTACTVFAPEIILEALIITAGIVLALTAYAFYASRKGKDFTFLGPILLTSLFALVMWGFVQLFFPMAPLAESIYALLGAIVFSGFIVFDTANLIQQYSLDQYVWASIALYLDILNLFLMILRLLGRGSD